MGLGHLNAPPGAGASKIDLIVSFRYPAAQPAVDDWKCSMEHASELLFAATGGRMQFGNVYYATDDVGLNEADFCVYDASFTPSSPNHDPTAEDANGLDVHLGRLGYGIAFPDQVKFQPYMVLHEFGHYGFDLLEEVVGGDRWCSRDELGTSCIMEFRTAVWGDQLDPGCVVVPPAFPIVAKTHFCSPQAGGHATAHLGGVDVANENEDTNLQHDEHKKSCIETIELVTAKFGNPINLPTPVGVPADVHEAIGWDELDDVPRFALLLDKSQSMTTNNAIEGVRSAGKYWVELDAAFGNNVAVIGYNQDAMPPVWEMQPLNAGNSIAASQAIDVAITAGGLTDIAEALRVGKTEITPPTGLIADRPEFAATQAMVLFTDGKQTVGPEPRDQLPLAELGDIVDKFIRVYTIGMGPAADINWPLLQTIAWDTKGLPQQILDPDEPVDPNDPANPTVLATREIMDATIFVSSVVHSGLVLVERGVLTEESGSDPFEVLVEDGADAVTFVVRSDVTDSIDLVVHEPESTQPLEPDDERVFHKPGVRSPYAMFVVKGPLPAGEWSVEVGGAVGTGAGKYRLFAFVSNKRLAIGSKGHQQTYDPSDEPWVSMRVTFGRPLTNLTEAKLIRVADGFEQVLDEQSPDSGHYSTRLPRHPPGNHEYFAILRNEDSAEFVQEPPPIEDEERVEPSAWVEGDIPPFVRIERFFLHVADDREPEPDQEAPTHLAAT